MNWATVRSSCKLRGLAAACALALATQASPAGDAPDGAAVVERLAERASPTYPETARLRAALAARPQDLALAVPLARRYVERARADADPRYLGYAQAALAPWWTQQQAPADVLMLRAGIQQEMQRYDAALADLDTALRRDPASVQAWLTRFTILLATGEHAAARASCGRLQALAPPLVVQACLASAAAATGAALRTYPELAAQLERNPDADASVRAWIATVLAEIAARHGDEVSPQMYFATALSLDAGDDYLRATYADFLLDRGRAPEAVRLLRDRARATPLLLRYALALQASGAPEAETQIALLRLRLSEEEQRGDALHLRERARLALAVDRDGARAVRLARANWAVRKEPADLRLLLEAAAAAQDRAAARIALDWMEQTGLRDVALEAPLRALGEQP